jgi:membrane associated rhomboid family serine protease
MFPIRDDVPSRTYPYATLGLIVLNVAIFLVQFGQRLADPAAAAGAVASFGLVPAQAAEGRIWPFFTSMFMHGGWFHLIGNMWYLWIFGDNVEDRLGPVKFVIFYVACGLIGNLGHYVFNSASSVPAVGASGAIAGVLGAYVVSYPMARILVVIPLFLFFHFLTVPALVVLGFWFIVQLASGTFSLAQSGVYGGVAWWAHIGGFLGGIAILNLFRPRPRIMYRP